MSNSYEINEHDEVVPYTAGRMCTDTRAWREATELELQQKQELKSISSEYSDYHDFAADRIAELEAENERLLVLATKWCDKSHHDWQEILKIGGEKGE